MYAHNNTNTGYLSLPVHPSRYPPLIHRCPVCLLIRRHLRRETKPSKGAVRPLLLLIHLPHLLFLPQSVSLSATRTVEPPLLPLNVALPANQTPGPFRRLIVGSDADVELPLLPLSPIPSNLQCWDTEPVALRMSLPVTGVLLNSDRDIEAIRAGETSTA